MTRTTLFVSLILLPLAPAATGQTDSSAANPRLGWSRPVAHYGRWATAATAVALTWMGAREHARSADAWDQLLDLCRANNADCTLGPDGRYLNATAEQYYQTSLRFDRRARSRLLAGQGALLVTVGLFILDLRHGKNGPANIPFAPLDVSADGATRDVRVGLRFAF